MFCQAELAAMLSSPAETAALRQLLTVTQEAQSAGIHCMYVQGAACDVQGGAALDPFLLLRFLRARQGSVEVQRTLERTVQSNNVRSVVGAGSSADVLRYAELAAREQHW